MAYAMDSALMASEALPEERVAFIQRTYAHLAGAILAFVAIEAVLVNTVSEALVLRMVGGYGWLVVLLAFMGVSYIADSWARSDKSVGMQYLGLGLYVVAEAIIFVPILYIAKERAAPNVIPIAALITLGLTAGLMMIVFVTGQDFSWMRASLQVGTFIALGAIVAAIIFGFTLGVLFSVALATLASGYVIYTTSNVLHHYRTDAHVAAALALFASVALLFWYILQIVMRVMSRD